MARFNSEETDRLARWILKNPGKWNSGDSRPNMCNGELLAEWLQMLKDAECYQMITVLLTGNKDSNEKCPCTRIINLVQREINAEIWDKETIIQVTDKIINRVKKGSDI